MQDMFGLEFDLAWVLELDSSSPTKFSRHLIIRIPGMAFQSNIHAGCVVAHILQKAASGCKEFADQLLVNQVSAKRCPLQGKTLYKQV